MKLDDIKYKLHVDLDGVLADFIKGVKKLIPDYKDGEYANSAKYRKEMWAAVNKHRKEGGELWSDLELMDDAMELWDYVKKYNPEILTATGKYQADGARQKKGWVREKFGSDVKVTTVRMSQDKSFYAAPNHILIDDMKKSINPWTSAGGIGILHTSAKDTIKQLKELGL